MKLLNKAHNVCRSIVQAMLALSPPLYLYLFESCKYLSLKVFFFFFQCTLLPSIQWTSIDLPDAIGFSQNSRADGIYENSMCCPLLPEGMFK